jgi:hypothetical protein
LVEHLGRRHTELETERPIAIVGEEPVVGRSERHPGRDEDRLVASAGNLEEYLVLTLELDLLIVQPPREIHRSVGRHELVAAEPRDGWAL